MQNSLNIINESVRYIFVLITILLSVNLEAQCIIDQSPTGYCDEDSLLNVNDFDNDRILNIEESNATLF